MRASPFIATVISVSFILGQSAARAWPTATGTTPAPATPAPATPAPASTPAPEAPPPATTNPAAANAGAPSAVPVAQPAPESLEESPSTRNGPTAPAPAPQVFDATLRGYPLVRLKTDNYRARLQTIGHFDGRWKDVCTSPCRLHLDPAAAYRVGGGNVNNSSQFSLPRGRSEVLVDAHTGSKTQFWVGTIMGLVGVSNVLGGLIYRSLGSDTGNNLTQDQRDTYKTLGTLELGIGAGMAVVGLIVAVTAGTSVDVQ